MYFFLYIIFYENIVLIYMAEKSTETQSVTQPGQDTKEKEETSWSTRVVCKLLILKREGRVVNILLRRSPHPCEVGFTQVLFYLIHLE